ncbi:hypothetical protein BGZ94_001052 [Podila epigama]|nr:hypothetical protein BGZ94_001052 [Podila epigama]
MKFTQTIVAVVLATLFVASSADAACVCDSKYAGKHCGQSPLMKGCKKDYLYQCNGTQGSKPHVYGPCTKGCVYKGLSKDYCKDIVTDGQADVVLKVADRHHHVKLIENDDEELDEPVDERDDVLMVDSHWS